MNLPRVLIVSTERGKANEIAIKMGADKLPDQDGLQYYIWHIENKYYITNVLLCVAENPSTDLSIEHIEALIIYHDPNAANVDQDLEQWSPLISSLTDTEILLFSCDSIKDATMRNKVRKWCLQKKFELIELNGTEDLPESELEHNKYGMDRIIEALHAHMWPNVILKGKVGPRFKDSNTSMTEENPSDMDDVEEQLDNMQISQNSLQNLQVENALDGLMGGENADFGELFSHLMAMKEHAASLPRNQRRIAAEQLVTAFWRAVGGDLLEIDD